MNLGKDGRAYKVVKRAISLKIGNASTIGYYDKCDIPISNRNLVVRVLFDQDDTVKEFKVCSTEKGFEYLPLNLSQERINFVLDEIDAMCDAKEKKLKELSEFPLDTPF